MKLAVVFTTTMAALLFAVHALAQSISISVPAFPTAGQPGPWQISDPSLVKLTTDSGGTQYLSVTNPASSPAPLVYANYDLPLDKVRGSLLECSAMMRVANVSQPPQPWLGVKLMVHVVSPTIADTWDQAGANGSGTFPASYDWTRRSFETTIPDDATSAILTLGLQSASGEADFRDIHLAVIRPRHVSSVQTGPVYTGHGLGSLRGVMISPHIESADVATLAKWHVNLVRWQLNDDNYPQPLANTETMPQYDAWLAGSLHHLDELLPYFKKAGILVTVDLHTPPGGMDASGIHRIFTDKTWQQHFIDLWKMMASRYRNEKQIWGYDLVNEPITAGFDTGVTTWHDLAQTTARAIRKIDTYHAIIVEPDPGGGVTKLAFLQPIDVSRVVYQVHMYDPDQFTMQAVYGGSPTQYSYPGNIAGQLWDKARIEKEFEPVAQFAKDNHVQIYVGEFSAARWTPGADKYLADVISVLEEHHWDWSYHAFREWQGWSVEIGEDPNVTTLSPTPTAREQVLLAAFSKNRPAAVAGR